MAQITGIRAISKQRCEVALDSGDAIRFHPEVVLRLGLKSGQTVDAESLLKAAALEESVRAREYALDLLSRAGRSRRQMEDRLKRKGYSPEVVEQTVDKLLRSGLLNDEAFARMYVAGRVADRPMGRRALRQELAIKGVDREISEQAVDSVLEGKSELDLALKAARARWTRLAGLPADEAMRKMLGYLARRGFSSGVCWSAVRQVAQSPADGADFSEAFPDPVDEEDFDSQG